MSYVYIRVTPLNSDTKKKNELSGLTNEKGEFSFSFSEPISVQALYLGYTLAKDTFYEPGAFTLYILESTQNLKDVVITGNASATSIQKSVYETRVITTEMIQQKGANNLREALQNELNIDLGNDQVFGSNMSINGISGEGVKLMVDGVPVVGRLDGKIDLSQINLNNIERIEVVEGPLSVMYGTDAMGGVINIITKTFQTEKVNVNLKGYYETVGQYNIELNTGFSFKRNQIYLSGGRNFFDGFNADKTAKRFLQWKPKEQYFADAKYMLSGARYKFSTTASFFREMMIGRGEIKRVPEFVNNIATYTYAADDVRFETYRPRASASFTYRFKEDYQLDAMLAYSGFVRFVNKYYKNLVTQKEQLVNDISEQDTTVYHQVVFRSIYGMPAWKKKLLFQFGVEVNQEFTDQKRIKEGHQQSGDYAAFGIVKINLVKGLDIQPAIRIAYNTRFAAPLIPSLNIKYNFDEKFVLRASYGKGYRAPSLKELYLEFYDSNHNISGNDELKPENGHNAQISGSYYHNIKEHQLTFSVSGFYNFIKNKIDMKLISTSVVGPNAYQYFNVKNYCTYGGDASIAYKWNRLQLQASGMITQYILSNREDKSDRTTAYSPDVSATASYRIPKAEIGINVMYKYNGRKPLFSVNNSIQAGFRNAYHSIDISLSRNFWKDRIQVVVGAKNLAGVKNVAANGVSGVGHNFNSSDVNIGWGRTFFSTLILHFGK